MPRKLLLAVASLVITGVASAASAQALPAPSPLTGAEHIQCLQNEGNKNCTLAQLAALTWVCPHVEAFGGKGDGSTANDTAFANALAASPTNNKCVSFGAGTYAFSNAISVALTTGQSFTIRGASQFTTSLSFANHQNGFAVTEADNTSSVHFRDLSIFTQSHDGAETAVSVTQNTGLSGVPTERSDFTNVTLRGSDGISAKNYWGTAIFQQASNFDYHNVTVYGSVSKQGTGLTLQGNNSGTGNNKIGIVADITDSSFLNVATGLNYGNVFQGVEIKGVNFTACGTGIYQAASLASSAQLAVSNSQFDCSTDIDLESGVNGTTITGSYFISRGNSTAMMLKGAYNFNITGNYFENDWTVTPTRSTGINVSGWSGGSINSDGGWGTIDNNVFNAFSNAITLQATSRNVVVGAHNVFDQPQGTQVANGNTSNQNCVGTCRLYNVDAVTFGAGTTGIGSGGRYSAPTCNVGHACDSISGEMTFTTGANASAATGENLVAYVTLPVHANKYSCTISAYAAGDATFHGWRPAADTGHVYVYENAALANNTQYYVDYVCGGR